MKTVGILGGTGPEATVLLLQRILAATPARDDADHIPLIVHQNPQVPSRIRHLIEGTGDDPGPVLALIRQVKTGDSGAAAQQILARLADDAAARSDHLLIACSELSLMSGAVAHPFTDSLDCLVDAICTFAKS